MKKVYLETPEAVIKALKEGKVIRDENNYSFKIVDGFIVATYDGYFYIGYTIYGIDKPYILEEEPLKIEVGKWYETRDHQKARCFMVEKERCHFTIDHYCRFFTNKNGIHLDNETSRYDIIGLSEEDKQNERKPNLLH